jgi:hypothetical protein
MNLRLGIGPFRDTGSGTRLSWRHMPKIKHAPAILGSTDVGGVCSQCPRAVIARLW